ELGLHLSDFIFRDYDQQIGRFTGVDLLADDGQSNFSPYHFTGGDPANFIDPIGLNRTIYQLEGVEIVAKRPRHHLYDFPFNPDLSWLAASYYFSGGGGTGNGGAIGGGTGAGGRFSKAYNATAIRYRERKPVKIKPKEPNKREGSFKDNVKRTLENADRKLTNLVTDISQMDFLKSIGDNFGKLVESLIVSNEAHYRWEGATGFYEHGLPTMITTVSALSLGLQTGAFATRSGTGAWSPGRTLSEGAQVGLGA